MRSSALLVCCLFLVGLVLAALSTALALSTRHAARHHRRHQKNQFVPPNVPIDGIENSGVDPDVYRNISQMIVARGYPCIDYEVPTPDGFLLSVQRMPNPGKPVVFLQHGLLDTALSWVENFPQESLGFMLFDAGFDVWMGNNRGNTYSMSNTKYSPSEAAFWAWSFDEMAEYDLPSMINFALESTGHSSLAAYVGHSQGTIQAFAAFTTNQDISKKVDLFVALAPVAHVGNISAIPFRAMADIHLEDFYELFGIKDFMPDSDLIKHLDPEACKVDPRFCGNLFCLLFGCDSNNLNQTRMPVYTAHDPAGTSVQNMAHWAQLVRTRKFQMYDYGTPSVNIAKYGQPTPPQYNLENLMVPVALFYGGVDTLADPKDVDIILERTPEDLLVFSQLFPDYGHIDFIWGLDAQYTLYPKVIQLIQQTSNSSSSSSNSSSSSSNSNNKQNKNK